MAEVSVLVVEDDPAIRELLMTALGERYAVTTAENATAALAALSTSAPDLLLADCVLPGGGLDQVLEKADASSVSVLLTSSHPEQIYQFGGGKRPFLPKPYKLADLMDAVTEIIGVRQVTDNRCS